MLDLIFTQAPVFLLIYGRTFALLLTIPMFSMRSVPRIAKLALAFYMSFFLLRTINISDYVILLDDDGVFSFQYILILAGEVLIGIMMGLFISIVFAAFSSAGQFIGFQIGLSAASSYDSMSQVENPLMGQFFNFAAMLIFLQSKWFQQLFLGGLSSSFKAMTAMSFVTNQDSMIHFLLRGLTNLFADAMIIALPIMGSLFLITMCTGLLTKAAPQMNLLSEGFPIMILLGYFIILIMMPALTDFCVRAFRSGFADLQSLFINISGGIK